MSKILDLSLAIDPNIALFTAGTINFLQLSYKESISAAIIDLIEQSYGTDSYNPRAVYVLHGITDVISGGNHNVSAGAVFHDSEVYLYPGGSISVTADPLIANLLIGSYSSSLGGDPMTFTVSGTSNVHNDRVMQLVTGTSGSGTLTGDSFSDFTNFLRLGVWRDTGSLTLTPFGGGISSIVSLISSRFRIIGKTLFWNLRCTISTTGVVNGLQINPSTPFPFTFKSLSSSQFSGVYDGTAQILIEVLSSALFLTPVVASSLVSFDNSGVTKMLEFNFSAEIN